MQDTLGRNAYEEKESRSIGGEPSVWDETLTPEREGRQDRDFKKKKNAQITGASEIESARLVERTQARAAPWRKSKSGKKLWLWSSSGVESWARRGPREAWPEPECRENPQIQQGGCQVPYSWCS